MVKVKKLNDGKLYCPNCDSVFIDNPELCSGCGEKLDYSGVLRDHAKGDEHGFDAYSLYIQGTRKISIIFASLEELSGALAQYLSPSEIRAGVVKCLTTFDKAKAQNGYVENKWNRFSVCAYIPM